LILSSVIIIASGADDVAASNISNVSSVSDSREVISLDADWRFHLGDLTNAVNPAYDDSDWRQVDVPHDYVIEGKFTETNPYVITGDRATWYGLHGSLPAQPAWYRKALSIPAMDRGKRIWLEFDGVFSNSRYWFNGREIGSQYSGYNRFNFDITDAVKFGGRNILSVQVDPRWDGWWYEGGGIYRHVRLVIVDPVHVAPQGIFVAATVADPGDGIRADATVAVHTDLTNETSALVAPTVMSEILDADGKVILSASATQSLAAGADADVAETLSLPSAHLRSPEMPYLYKLRSTISAAGKIVDEVTTSFGVRQVRFDAARGFFLNGKNIKLMGVTMHVDHAGVGVAMPDRLFEWRLERLKEVGCNAIRLSHNPEEPVMLDVCDLMGFLVVAENRHLGDTYADQTPKNTPAVEHRDLASLVIWRST
jgi:beta-galactosidase